MAGIYIHIPFCKQRCYYCDFHFSTSLKHKDEMINTISKEIELRKDEIKNEEIKTIYFGGGSPSILDATEIETLLNSVYSNYKISEDLEITLEANPDDLDDEKINGFKVVGINRFSMGIQSFFDEDLKFMNRVHDSEQAIKSLNKLISAGFENITADLIYGIPNQSEERLRKNIETMTNSGVKHISAYALTVEKNTPLYKLIERKKYPDVDDAKSLKDYNILVEELKTKGFKQYEVSNFALIGYESKHNSSYWFNEKYLGFGPSAHSFDGNTRRWNVSNNKKYLDNFETKDYFEIEILSNKDRYNELVMTRLRTKWGINIGEVKEKFGLKQSEKLLEYASQHIANGNLILEDDILRISEKGMFFADGISSDLFEL